ncbi:hypothetical protein [Rhodoferax sediminis]|uniref:Uncharacterized protein n=1 Tax=Rhodoferax sediminis TaxID=2509614 RepID=A0A515D7U3_9BURK|nr:hypothetical protein [Rhodoferax sediminis]QDL36479.1 hypothetical protein EUB48_03590 [Rhodoferax sediminis]
MNEAEFERHVRTGERNKQILELVHNWCSHAEVRNHGGTGLIAQYTGLPLGMLGMHCDHAPAGGVAGWYLEVGVLDFYDRNCVHCDKRQAVRLPNLIQLVGERDREVARRKEESERAQAAAAAARDARKRRRDALRVSQSAATCALLDDLEALDNSRSKDARTRVVETARLAPEILTPPIVEYFFELAASDAGGCQAEALDVLRHVGADAKRLTAAALNCLVHHNSIDTAARIVTVNPSLAEEAAVEAAVPALVGLASPPRPQFGDRERHLQPEPLLAVFAAWPEPVNRGIQRLLDSRQSYRIRIGTAALKVLSPVDPYLLGRFAKTLVAKLVRAHLLIDEDEADRELNMVCSDLQRSLAAALLQEPMATDQLIADFFEGASSEGEARLARVYEEVFRFTYRGKETLTDTVAGVVLSRIVRLASTSHNDKVLTEIIQMLRTGSSDLLGAARQALDVVLGAAALLDDRLEAFDGEQKLKANTTPLQALEAQNARSTLYYIRESFSDMAAKAAQGDRLATQSYVEFLGRIDESRSGLSSALLKESHHLIATPEGLNLVLPELYAGLVGASTLERAAAAKTLGEAGKERIADLPELVLEAFVLLLRDPYVIVHKAATTALGNIPLPPHLEQSADSALLQLILVYSSGKDAEDFLLRCMQLYLHRFADERQLRGELATVFIRILNRVSASRELRELNSMSKFLKDEPEYVDLVIRVFEDEDVSDYGEEDAMELAYLIPDEQVLKRADDLVKVAVRRHGRALYVGAIVEILTRAGAWAQAVTAAKASWEHLPDTVPMRRVKWVGQLQLVAVQFEAAVATGDEARLTALKSEWEGLEKALQEDEKLYAERRNPLPSFFRTHSGS